MEDLTKNELDVLRSYASGPKIWDAASLQDNVSRLRDLGLIEPVPDPGRPGVSRITPAGRRVLDSIPFDVTLADGSTVQLQRGRYYLVRHRMYDAAGDRVMIAALRATGDVAGYGLRLVFNGSPKFGDQPVYVNDILTVVPAPMATEVSISRTTRTPRNKPPASRDRAPEICWAGDDIDGIHDAVRDAFDLASDQGGISWVTDASGKRLCAIVPVDVAERELALRHGT